MTTAMKITFLTIILPVMAFSASTRPRTGSMNQIIRQTRESQRPMRPRFESANSKDKIMETKKETFECYHFVSHFFKLKVKATKI